MCIAVVTDVVTALLSLIYSGILMARSVMTVSVMAILAMTVMLVRQNTSAMEMKSKEVVVSLAAADSRTSSHRPC
jgi:hypothetical protein